MYIGESKDIQRRFREHKSKLLTNTHANAYLQNYVNKFGINNFEFKVIEYCAKRINRAREHYWVTYFKTLNRKYGFNLKPTDPIIINKRSPEITKKIQATKKKNAKKRGYWYTKKTISARVKSRKGYKHSIKTKKKIGAKSIGRKLPKKTEAFKKMVSKMNTGRDSHFKKKIIQYNKDGKKIKTWESITDAAKFYNTQTGHIVAVCKQERKTHKNYIWKYE